MQHLETLLRSRDVDFDAHDRQIRCFPHIINICVKHVTENFSNYSLEDIAETFPNGADRTQYTAAVRSNPIKMGRSIVTAIRSSGLRRDDFLDTIRTGNARNWFRPPGAPIVTVPEHQLKHDSETRWDSTYDMIRRLIELRLVSHDELECPTVRVLIDTRRLITSLVYRIIASLKS